MTKRKKQVGGQPGNSNALQHGAYSERFTPDSPAGRLVQWIESTLTAAIPDPSPQEALILKRASVKAYRCDAIERQLLSNGDGVPESLEKSYLSWCRELREDLKLLGMEKRLKKVDGLQAVIAREKENIGN